MLKVKSLKKNGGPSNGEKVLPVMEKGDPSNGEEAYLYTVI